MLTRVHFTGDNAIVRQGGREVGHLYHYVVENSGGRWSVWARRYLLREEWKPEDVCEVRFLVPLKGGAEQLPFVGLGWFMGDEPPQADATLHRDEIVMEGTGLTLAS